MVVKITTKLHRELTMEEVDGTYMVLSNPVAEFRTIVQVGPT